MFRVVVKRHGQQAEEFDRVTPGRGKSNVATVVNAQSSVIRVEEISGEPVAKPATGEVALSEATIAAVPAPSVSSDDYVGDVADRTGFGGLETIDEITMLAVPDLMSAYQLGSLDLESVQAVQLAMIAHCELMGDRMAILDPPPGLNPQQVKEWRVDKAGYDSAFAVLNYPWIKTANPSTGEIGYMPPSGHVAGIWGRNDDTRGVHKAPANEVIRGAISLEVQVTKNEHDLLNPVGINVHPVVPRPRHPAVGRAHAVVRPGLAVPQRPPAVQLPRGVDPGRHQLGGLRAERRGAVGEGTPDDLGVPGQRVAQGRAVRAHPGRGVLRQVRRRDEPRRGHRRRPARRARSASRRSSRPSS